MKSDLMNALQEGEKSAVEYMEKRLLSDEIEIFAPIKQRKLKTFSDNALPSKKTRENVPIKQNRTFFARLLIVGQKRKINLREVLTYSLGNISLPLTSC